MTKGERVCFIGFYGIDRSLQFTLPSIQRNVIEPICGQGYRVVSAGHFNLPEFIDNARSGEHGIPLNRHRSSHLELDLLWQEHQPNPLVEPLLARVIQYPFISCNDAQGQIRRNLLYQLHSLSRLAQLKSLLVSEEVSLYVLLRPDLEYLDPLPVRELQDVLDGGVDLIVPSWQSWGGLNDRVAIANQKGCECYLNRISQVMHFVEEHRFIHAEQLLAYAARKSGLRVGNLNARARRVRATGMFQPERF